MMRNHFLLALLLQIMGGVIMDLGNKRYHWYTFTDKVSYIITFFLIILNFIAAYCLAYVLVII